MQVISIEEWGDGFRLTHKGKNYRYKGKTLDVFDMIQEKVNELMLKDREETLAKLVKDYEQAY